MSSVSLEFVRCLFPKKKCGNLCGELGGGIILGCVWSRGDFLSEQKYRQHGYRDRDRGEREKQSDRGGGRAPRPESFGPRSVQLAASHSVSRCGQCGIILNSLPDPVGQCPKCGFELHSCKQCTYFDPAARFECTQRIPERIPRKDQRNDCTFYAISVRIEKQTSTPASARPADAKQAFENLFKK